MLNKPVTRRILLQACCVLAMMYAIFETVVNLPLLIWLSSQPFEKQVFDHALRDWNPAMLDWLVCVFILCLVGGMVLGAGRGSTGPKACRNDDEDEAQACAASSSHHDEVGLARSPAWYDHDEVETHACNRESSNHDDSWCINPASGMPMIGGIGGTDALGNAYGFCDH